jgi:hypothetical protein
MSVLRNEVKVKLSTTPWRRIGRVEVQIREFFDLGTRYRWSASCPVLFTFREGAPCTHWIGGWVGPRADLDTVSKIKTSSPLWDSNPDHPIVQPVVSHYTDWATRRYILCGVFWNVRFKWRMTAVYKTHHVSTLGFYRDRCPICVCVHRLRNWWFRRMGAINTKCPKWYRNLHSLWGTVQYMHSVWNTVVVIWHMTVLPCFHNFFQLASTVLMDLGLPQWTSRSTDIYKI